MSRIRHRRWMEDAPPDLCREIATRIRQGQSIGEAYCATLHARPLYEGSDIYTDATEPASIESDGQTQLF